MTLPKYRIMVFLISLLGLVVPLFNARPVAIMVMSQAFGAVILPLTVGCIFYLTNRKDLMGEHKNNALTNLVFCLIMLFALFMSYLAIKGLLVELTG